METQALDDHERLTLGEVLCVLAFAREWRAERADADELAGLEFCYPLSEEK
jgi:hypothetical protein